MGCKQTNVTFSEKEAQEIVKEFKHILYRDRMTKERKRKDEEEPTFRPGILKNSEGLAKKKREKMAIQA